MAIPLHESPEQKRAVSQLIDQTLEFINSIEQIKLPRIVIERDKQTTYDSEDPQKQTIDDQTFKDIAKLKNTPQGSQIEGFDNIKVTVNAEVKLECTDGKVVTNQEIKLNASTSIGIERPKREVEPSREEDKQKTKSKEHSNPRSPVSPSAKMKSQVNHANQSTPQIAVNAAEKTTKEKTVEERVDQLVKNIQSYAQKAGKTVGVKGKFYNWSATPEGNVKIHKNGKTILNCHQGQTSNNLTQDDLTHFEKAMRRVVRKVEKQKQEGR